MRKFLVVVTVLVTLLMGAPASADHHVVPDYSGDLPGPAEGVAVDWAGNIYVSVGSFDPTAPPFVEVWKVDRDGNGSLLANIPGSPGGAGVVVRGRYVYVGIQGLGVFKIHKRTGDYDLVPGTDAIAFPNAMTFDWRGNLYISETYSFDDAVEYPSCVGSPVKADGKFGPGGIWVVPRGGEAELLLRDELLTAPLVPLFPDSPPSCTVVPFPVGANGIAFHRGHLYVASSERSLILKIRVKWWKRTLGDIDVFADLSDNPAFIGRWAPDGVDVDRRGNVYSALVNAA
ncbi:MAG: hypothetical protein QNJ88_10000, partial [Acidimicrobiia bacterium]|nr:hypothetical protein [Acidimicrobiia bacterium]